MAVSPRLAWPSGSVISETAVASASVRPQSALAFARTISGSSVSSNIRTISFRSSTGSSSHRSPNGPLRARRAVVSSPLTADRPPRERLKMVSDGNPRSRVGFFLRLMSLPDRSRARARARSSDASGRSGSNPARSLRLFTSWSMRNSWASGRARGARRSPGSSRHQPGSTGFRGRWKKMMSLRVSHCSGRNA